ncbi:retrovirus-related pol polyprotein from transposon TNT 1-94, partial [Tanacetum coccineum]
DEILNDDQSEHLNHNNDNHIIDNLPNIKDVQTSEPLSSLAEDASVSNTIPIPINHSLSIPSMASPAPQDKWSQDKHIEMVNIIGNLGAGILTRAMAKEVSIATAHECLFVDFLSEEEPKKSSEFPNHVCKLDKALYGLKKALRAWYKTLSTFLTKHKFVRGKIDNALFVYKSQTDVILVQIYVDDIILRSTSTKLCKQFAKLMTQKYEMSMMGVLTDLLRFQIKQSERGISINQEKYVKDLLKKYDINGSSLKHQCFYLKGYSYSDDVGCSMDRKSTLSTCQLLGGKLVCWSAKKQQSIAMSSTKAKYVAAVGCCANIQWMKTLLTNYDIIYEKNPIFCDNTSAISISNNPVLHSRTKHIDIRYHFVRDHIVKGDIELHFIPTQYQLADIFTKPLDEPTFKRLICELGMLNIDGSKPKPSNDSSDED